MDTTIPATNNASSALATMLARNRRNRLNNSFAEQRSDLLSSPAGSDCDGGGPTPTELTAVSAASSTVEREAEDDEAVAADAAAQRAVCDLRTEIAFARAEIDKLSSSSSPSSPPRGGGSSRGGLFGNGGGGGGGADAAAGGSGAGGVNAERGGGLPGRFGGVGKGIANLLSLGKELEPDGNAPAGHGSFDQHHQNVLPGRRGSLTGGMSYEAMRASAHQARRASMEAQRRAERDARDSSAPLTTGNLKALRRASGLPAFNLHEVLASGRRGSQVSVSSTACSDDVCSSSSRAAPTTTGSRRGSATLTDLAQRRGSVVHDSKNCSISISEFQSLPESRSRLAPGEPLMARHGCVAYLGLCQAKSPGDRQQPRGRRDRREAEEAELRRLRFATEFPREAHSLLTEAYGRVPDRSDASEYVVLEGTGMAACLFSPALGHPSVEYTALWFGARLLAWARREGCDLRCGLSSGIMMEGVRDFYGLPNATGRAVNLAARIMDCALPGQMLISSEHVVPTLREAPYPGEQEGVRPEDELDLEYYVDRDKHEVIVENDGTALVQAVSGTISLDRAEYSASSGGSCLLPFGTNRVPEKKWYLRLKPAELSYDPTKGVKAKVPPTELLRRHRRVGFVGVTHGQLAQVFRRVLDEDPHHSWDRIYLLFLNDERLEWIAENEKKQSVQELVADKIAARADLKELLKDRVRDLRFLEYDRPFYCASYWDWEERGGFIHVSPLVWGTDPRTCPAMNYHWIATDAGDDYVSYQDGLTSLLQTSRPI